MTDQARDIAAELDRRQRRRRRILLLVWAVLIALAVMYVRCGRGWGLFGGGRGTGATAGTGAGSATGSGSAAAPAPCAIRVTAAGITADGAPVDAPRAVAACAKSHAATVVVTGDAREGTWKTLCDALVAGHVAITVKGDAQVCPP